MKTRCFFLHSLCALLAVFTAVGEDKIPRPSSAIVADKALYDVVPAQVLIDILELESQLSEAQSKLEAKDLKILYQDNDLTKAKLDAKSDQAFMAKVHAANNAMAARILKLEAERDAWKAVAIQNKSIAEQNALVAEQNAQISRQTSSPSSRAVTVIQTAAGHWQTNTGVTVIQTAAGHWQTSSGGQMIELAPGHYMIMGD